MNSVKLTVLKTAARLFERQGYHATGLNEIVRESGAPRGSIYYYFPAGKEEIGAETALWSAAQTAEHIRAGLATVEDPSEAVRRLALGIAGAVEEAGFAAGGPLTILAAETAVGSDRMTTACREAYGRMQAAVAEKLSGKEDLAQFVLAVLEGAILLSRVEHSGAPLRRAADYLKSIVAQELRK